MNKIIKPETVTHIEEMGYSLDLKNTKGGFRIYVVDDEGLRVGSVFTPSKVKETFRSSKDIINRINGIANFTNSNVDDYLKDRLKEARSIALADAYENEKLSYKEIYSFAKKFDERSLFYLEVRLNECDLDVQEFQDKVKP
ncbi:TPA: hypothetical protein L4E34_006745, partial [Pseudomonas aeruginosa]|nr:hypothetical protein [Pseudomonas aeruginosa]